MAIVRSIPPSPAGVLATQYRIHAIGHRTPVPVSLAPIRVKGHMGGLPRREARHTGAWNVLLGTVVVVEVKV